MYLSKQVSLFLLAYLFIPLSAVQTISGKVISIKDGDTIEIFYLGKPLKIRLFGIDCPEKKQDFGIQAKKFTSDLCYGKYVTIIKHGNDKYKRLLGEVILPNGLNLNKELVRKGYAWRYKTSKDKTLLKLESEAKKEKRGLWAKGTALAPWEFRYEANHSHKDSK